MTSLAWGTGEWRSRCWEQARCCRWDGPRRRAVAQGHLSCDAEPFPHPRERQLLPTAIPLGLLKGKRCFSPGIALAGGEVPLGKLHPEDWTLLLHFAETG